MALSGALKNIYRQLEANECDFDLVRAPEPRHDDVPPAEHIFFGIAPGWSPGQEGGRKITLERQVDGEVVLVEGVCPTCLSGLGSFRMPDRTACAACLRTTDRDEARIRIALAAEGLTPPRN